MNPQSALEAAGPQAARIASLWWFMFWVFAAVFVIVIGTMLWALLRRGGPADERKMTRVVGAATGLTVAILLLMLVASVSTGRAISRLGPKERGMTVEVTGNQWWWDVRYANDDASRIVVTANEIHVPVGRPVMIRGSSRDVIHSFWPPNLNGKIDFIPSRITTQWFVANQPGRFRGQCAEFCGLQHAHMALWIVAEPPDVFEAWMQRQLQPAPEPATPAASRGRDVFLQNPCVMCHSISGTDAAGRVAPDLTHVGSRLTIAAGTLPNTRENLRRWIRDPHAIKPGNHMPTIALADADLDSVVDYLETLR
jgi:cytochrome c oxidase subunit 2